MNVAHFIFYVSDQTKSAEFYTLVLGTKPRLNVPGMTEFEISAGSVLGLMPEMGIKKLLGDKIKDPSTANGIPRAELYLVVNNPKDVLQRAILAGATLASPFQERDWGHSAGYVCDPDGHILGFASLD